MARRSVPLILAVVLLIGLSACGAAAPTGSTNVDPTPVRQNEVGAIIPTAAPAATSVAESASGGAAPAATAAAGSADGAAPDLFSSAPGDAAREGPLAPGAAPLAGEAETMSTGDGSSATSSMPLPPVPAPAGVGDAERTAPEASLRAGEIDDNAAFADYLDYLAEYQARDVRRGDVSERYLINVLDARQRPVLDARVTVYDGERVLFQGRTYAGGTTIFLPTLGDTANVSAWRVVAEYGQSRAETTVQRGSSERIELGLREEVADDPLRLDLLFLLDTTGSMDDELSRIQETIDSIAARIDAFSPRPAIRYGLVAYRDEGDAYVTRPVAFSEDLGTFRSQLRQLEADGGGDTPEALDEALYEAVVRADWRDEPTVRLAFLVADAGPHVPGTSQFNYLDATREALLRGVKLYPIAASNTDPQAEYVFRQLAQQTLAGFVFLTYQPGASGGSPGESTTLEAGEQPYTVERLDDLIVNIVERELAAAVGVR